MTKKNVTARVGFELLYVAKFLLRAIGALCSVLSSFLFFAWGFSDKDATNEDGLSEAEQYMRDLDQNFEHGGYYNYDRY